MVSLILQIASNMKNLPTDLLRTFVSVAQLGSFTKAGELLGRSQPAISLQISRLEELASNPLLSRSGQSMELTDAGRILYKAAQQMLSINDQVLGQLDPDTITGKVRLGIPSEFATTLLPKIVSRFANANPNIRLEVNCDLSKNLLSKAGLSSHDLVLTLHDDLEDNQQHQVKVDELVWVTSQSHDTHLQKNVSLIAAPEGCIYRKRATQALNQLKLPWQIVYTIRDLTGIQAAIETGMGVTVLAKSTVPKNLRILKPSDKYPPLGKIGICLIDTRNGNSAAVNKISEYFKFYLR